MNKEKLKKIRIFAAAPQDVRQERECLESLIQQLNKPGEIAGQMGMTLELIDRDSKLSGLSPYFPVFRIPRILYFPYFLLHHSPSIKRGI